MGKDGGGGAVGSQILFNVAFGDSGGSQLGLPDLKGLGVQQQVQHTAGLLQFFFQDGTVAGLLVDHPVAVGVDQNGAHGPAHDVTGDGGFGNAGIHLDAVGIALAILHVGGLGIHGLGHADAVTGGGGGAVVECGLHFIGEHILVVAVAAGGQHHIGSMDGVFLGAVGGNRLHAHHSAVLHQQGLYLGAQVHSCAAALHRLAHSLGKACAAAGVGQLTVVAVLAQLMQTGIKLDAAGGNQPVGGGTHIFGKQGQDFFVVLAGAVGLEISDHGLHAVVLHAIVRLELGTHNHLVAAGNGDGTAQEGGLLKQNDLLPQLCQTDCGAHTGTAAAHYHYIGGQFFLDVFTGCNLHIFQGFHVAACLLDGIGYRFHNTVAGVGCAGNGIHTQALGFHDLRGDVGNGRVTQAGGFGMRDNGNALNFFCGEGDLYRDVTILARPNAGVGAGGVGSGLGGLRRSCTVGSHAQNHCKHKNQG